MTIVMSGLAVGSLYALVALGYGITYISSGVINFAQGYLIMLGTFLAYQGLNTFKVPLPVVIIGAAVTVGVANAFIERLCIRLLRDRHSHTEMVTTVGAATIISGVVTLIWGSDPLALHLLQTSLPIHVLGGLTTSGQLILLGLTIGVGISLMLVASRTRIGLFSRAVAEDREAASLRGIDVNRLSVGAFILAGLITGALGPIVGVETFAVVSLGPALAVKGFVVLALGGPRNLEGALVCGLAIGVIEAETGRYLSGSWEDIVTYLVFIIVLAIRPSGLFSRTSERLV
jgi:branched-chain amino acid transport system permease protein